MAECYTNWSAQMSRTRFLPRFLTVMCPAPHFNTFQFLAMSYMARLRFLSAVLLYPFLNFFICSHLFDSEYYQALIFLACSSLFSRRYQERELSIP